MFDLRVLSAKPLFRRDLDPSHLQFRLGITFFIVGSLTMRDP